MSCCCSEAVDLKKGIIKLTNRYDFIGLDSLQLAWNVMADGVVLQNGKLDIDNIQPGQSGEIAVPFRMPENPAPGTEYWHNLRIVLAYDTNWAKQGHEVAWAQFKLPVESPSLPPVKLESMPPIVCHDLGGELKVEGVNFELVFDKISGVIISWTYEA